MIQTSLLIRCDAIANFSSSQWLAAIFFAPFNIAHEFAEWKLVVVIIVVVIVVVVVDVDVVIVEKKPFDR